MVLVTPKYIQRLDVFMVLTKSKIYNLNPAHSSVLRYTQKKILFLIMSSVKVLRLSHTVTSPFLSFLHEF